MAFLFQINQGCFHLLLAEGKFSFYRTDKMFLFQFLDGTVKCFDGDTDLLIELLPCLWNHAGRFMFFSKIFDKIIKEKILWRIKEFAAPVIRGAVQFVGDFSGNKTEKLNVIFDPVFKIFSGKIKDGTFGQCFNRHGSAFFFSKDGDFPYKIDGIVPLDHVDVAVFKFVNYTVGAFTDNSEVFQWFIFLMDNCSRWIGMYPITLV